MTNDNLPPGLWQETRQAAEVWRQARGPGDGEPAESGSGPAGQVRILSQLDEPRLAWAVLREEDGRLLLVAADTNPLVGSGDVPVGGPGIGPLILRCRFAVWGSERELAPFSLLGRIAPEALARAESRWQALAAGRPLGTFSEEETDEDPEYQDWIEEVIRPAAGKLEALAGVVAASPAAVLPFPERQATVPERRAQPNWIRWAAVLAFAVLGAGGSYLGWQKSRENAGLRAAVAAGEAARRQAVAELETRRAALEAQYQARLQKAGEDRARLEAEHRAQVAELEAQLGRLRLATVIKNPLLQGFDPNGSVRGTQKIEVGPEVTHLFLVLPLKEATGAEYRVEISEQSSGHQAFVQEGLWASDAGEVRLGIPVALLPPADYSLRLLRKEKGGWQRVQDYRFEIQEKPRRRPQRW